jgi:hypothetical protein
MDILDDEIDVQGDDLGGRDRTSLINIGTILLLKGIAFLLLGLGNFFISILIIRQAKYRYSYQSGQSYFEKIEWEPLILFGVSSILALFTGYFALRTSVALKKSIHEHNLIAEVVTKRWSTYHQFTASLVGFVAVDVAYLIVKHAL